jgi:hypothetical protein
MKDSSWQVVPADLRNGRPKIVIDATGSFVAFDMPGLLKSSPQLDSGSGDWKLVSREGQQQIQLDFQIIANWNKTNLPYGTQLDVSRGWSSVSLFYFIGDPDKGRMIEFEKK